MNNVISISSYRKTKPLPLPHPGPPPLPPAPWHMQIARWCLVWHRALPHVAGLQEHEVRFLIQMLEREQSTERQDAWLAKLGRKVENRLKATPMAAAKNASPNDGPPAA